MTSTARELTRMRLLPWTGVAAGVTGALATMMSSTAVTAADRRADPSGAVVAAFDGLAITLKASAALGFLAIGLLVVFVADLRRRLAAHEPASGLAPVVAWAGGLIAAATLCLSFIVAATGAFVAEENYRDTTLEVFSALADNLAFAAWTPLGLTMAAVAAAALRHASAPRWLGVVSAVALAALGTALVVGLPFASWAIGCLWLVLAGLAHLRDRDTPPIARPEGATS